MASSPQQEEGPEPVVVTVVHCWSAPRSRSTALLYSFEARGSTCAAVDEPLYRRWLKEKGDSVERPYAKEFIEGVPPEGKGESEEERRRWAREKGSLEERIAEAAERVVEAAAAAIAGGESSSCRSCVVFCKHMAKHSHLYDFASDREIGSASTAPSAASSYRIVHRHALLIRDPASVLGSWGARGSVHGNETTPDEVGMVPLLSVYSSLVSRPGGSSSAVAVLDSDALVSDPEGTLKDLCEDLGIDYADDMLTWESGPHECDGPWADWWYADVHKSTGWLRGHTTSSSGTANDSASGEGKGDDDAVSYPQQYVPPSVRKYRTLDPSLIDALRASIPAYRYLRSLTRQHKERGLIPTEDMYEDPRNANLLVWVGAAGGRGGGLVPRDMAGVNPWDSSVQGGDACWEGLRIYRGKVLSLEKHLRRMFRSAKALGFYMEGNVVHTKEEVIEALFRTLAANGMRDGAHVRLTLTRGEKCTSSMNPKFNVYGTTLIVLPEWKPVEGATTYDNISGISLITASHRRNPPSTGVDSKIHHNNMINNILPKIQANHAGAADAIMLDVDGYVSETNATNIFMVDENGVLLTPHADHCLPGITRETVLILAKELGIPAEVRRVSLAEFHAAEEVFTTGTMGELTPVTTIDGRPIGTTGKRGPITERLQEAYRTVPDRGDGWATDLPPFS